MQNLLAKGPYPTLRKDKYYYEYCILHVYLYYYFIYILLYYNYNIYYFILSILYLIKQAYNLQPVRGSVASIGHQNTAMLAGIHAMARKKSTPNSFSGANVNAINVHYNTKTNMVTG